jgi:hypothetical protein
MLQPTAKFASLLFLITAAACPAPDQGDEHADDEQADDEQADDETSGADFPVDSCAGEPVPESDMCGATDVFEWDGTRCVSVCPALDPAEHTLFDSAYACFAVHTQCIDAEQCELGPVGVTDVSGFLSQSHPGLHAGAFNGDRLYLGPDAVHLGAALLSDFVGEHGAEYPSVLGIESDTGWQVGVHEVSITELGSWGSTKGTVTIESVTTEGNPNEWRLRGQIEVDENGQTLSGSFEVAGCVL